MHFWATPSFNIVELVIHYLMAVGVSGHRDGAILDWSQSNVNNYLQQIYPGIIINEKLVLNAGQPSSRGPDRVVHSLSHMCICILYNIYAVIDGTANLQTHFIDLSICLICGDR